MPELTESRGTAADLTPSQREVLAELGKIRETVVAMYVSVSDHVSCACLRHSLLVAASTCHSAQHRFLYWLRIYVDQLCYGVSLSRAP